MDFSTILTFVGGAASWGAVTKLLGPLYSEYRRRADSHAATRTVVHQQLDPILKAADELAGKLRSLAEEDFVEFRSLTREADFPATVNVGSVLYLFAQFWAHLEVLRREAVYVTISEDKVGKQLWGFLRCLESRRVRVVDRAWQRAIGESLLIARNSRTECLNFYEFLWRYLESSQLRDWYRPLYDVIVAASEKKGRIARQRLLQYGVVVHALLDTLDP